MSVALRERRLRALGVTPLVLRRRVAATPSGSAAADSPVPAPGSGIPVRRLALCPDPAELRDPALNEMYAALGAAVGKAGLQAVRVCDAAGDPAAVVVVFGVANLPVAVPAARVLRVDSLTVLNNDRERKRSLWKRMQALGRGGTD